MAHQTLALLALVACGGLASAVHLEFSSGLDGWTHSSDEKYTGKFEVATPEGLSSRALKVTEKAHHYGISKLLPEPVDPASDLVLQYELKLTNGLTCGGAYIKFVTADEGFTPTGLKDDTPYTVMFGPDKCGSTNKVHLILRHKSPKTGKIEEKHLKMPPLVGTDSKTHVYTAILRASNNTIADPDAKKPEDWDEDAPRTIPDDEAKKPEGWLDDEPPEIDDATAQKPEDWDEDEDGEWEPSKMSNPKCKDAPGCGEWKRPTKPNPAYKGKWSAPMIDNPAYKGVWKPRDIPNPDYEEDDAPLTHIGKVGAAAIEIWTMDDGYFFDNVVVSNSEAEAAEVREKSWAPKKVVEDAKEAEEKAKVAAKAEAEKKKTEAAEAADNKLKALVSTIFDLPFLKPLEVQLRPVRTFCEEKPILLLGALSTLLLLPVTLLLTRIMGGKQDDEVGEAKKQDVTGEDDEAEEEPAKKNGKREGQEEIEEEADDEEEEEEEEQPKAGTRRRTRRD